MSLWMLSLHTVSRASMSASFCTRAAITWKEAARMASGSLVSSP